MSRLKIALPSIFLGCVLSGCLFAPCQYGNTGIVVPGCVQYARYLENCRKKSSELDSACCRWGYPVAIKIGRSGGYFMWNNPSGIYCVGSFGRTRYTNRIPRDMRRYSVLQSGPQNPDRRVGNKPVMVEATVVSRGVAKLPEQPLPIKVVSLSYDSRSGTGLMVVDYGNRDFSTAREWAKSNIETIVRDKNVALVTGERPKEAKYYIGSERVNEKGFLEIEFATE